MRSDFLEDALVMDAVRVCEAAAIAASDRAGRGDELAADQAAVDAMRATLNTLAIDGLIVIGEGGEDQAPMLFVGERVGQGGGASLDIALDPLEGASLAAKAMADALTAMAWAPRGTLLHVPDIYMHKIACGPGYAPGLLNLDAGPAQNVRALAAAKGVEPSQITVCVLDRPRHAEIIAALREVGAKVRLIADGDIAGVINTADLSTGVDLYLGQGGAPEGVLACAALKCMGGQFQGKLAYRNADDRALAVAHGIADLDKTYDLHELVSAEALFVATGVTDGAMLDGVKSAGGFRWTHSVAMSSASGTVRQIRAKRPA